MLNLIFAGGQPANMKVVLTVRPSAVLRQMRHVARDRQGDVFLRSELRGIDRLGIEVKSRRYLRVTEKLLNCLYVVAPADQKSREAVTGIMEAKRLSWASTNSRR